MSEENSNLFNSFEQEQEKKAPAEETPKQEETATTPQPDGGESQQPDKNALDQMLAGITSADGRQKYSSVEDALGALPHAQKHISQLEQENKELKENMARLEERLEQMSKYEELLAKQPSQDSQSDNSGKGLDEATIAELVQQQLTQA